MLTSVGVVGVLEGGRVKWIFNGFMAVFFVKKTDMPCECLLALVFFYI